LHLNRNFPQVFKEGDHKYGEYSFGVELHQTVDQYQKSMRSVKYAAMFITLTFLVFFFTEIINQKAIHPIQYILIGLALVVFFTLLISLAEHIGFNTSYMLAASAVVALITFYTHAVLKSLRLTAIMATVLIVLYGFIYTIIQLEDFALLFGSIGLFLFLATMMIASRKIDWYQIVKKEEE
jgi:inner membrane protein